MHHILLTGGAGYIGSHIATELLSGGVNVTILDDFSNSDPSVCNRIADLSGKSPRVICGDVRDRGILDAAFGVRPDAVIHLAGLKAVAESVIRPVHYYDVNICGAVSLLKAMDVHGVRNLIFSSSATVYGDPGPTPVSEDAPLSALNPYGETKLLIEKMIRDWCSAGRDASAVSLRYFNPVGAHPSGRIGDAPSGTPNNLFPIMAEVLSGRRDRLAVFGGDHPTPDGSCIRDYIHVGDLAKGHISALKTVLRGNLRGMMTPINLGCGRGYSVLEVIRAFETAAGKSIPHVIAPARPGDAPLSLANPDRAERLLGWRADPDLSRMCADALRFQQGLKGETGRRP